MASYILYNYVMRSHTAVSLCDATGIGVLADSEGTARVAFVGLYSNQYPSIGESHGLSAVAGVADALSDELDLEVRVLDLVEFGIEGDAQIVDLVEQWKPHVLALALNYGTYSVLKRVLAKLRDSQASNPLIVIGGALATYQAQTILTELSHNACVVIGEGELATDGLLRRLRDGRPLTDVPSLAFALTETTTIAKTQRELVPLDAQPSPARSHLVPLIKTGGQIFVESSRGCSWAACTFCLRGLTDVSGHSREFRSRKADWVVGELHRLQAMGVKQITFADEDFLGADLPRSERLATSLASPGRTIPTFDASFTVHSIFNRRDDSQTRSRRKRVVSELARAGLQKAFLGIESCSPTQLRRYAKGHTREESVEAAQILREAGVRVEIGVILFDPLCTVAEIADSLRYMRANRLASIASGISSELRLQSHTPYKRMLEAHEQRTGRVLHSPDHDPDTLSHEYDFDSPLVAKLFERVRYWNGRMHAVYYPAKSLSRFGEHGALGEYAGAVRGIVANFRNATCDAIVDWIETGPSHNWEPSTLDKQFSAAGIVLAIRLNEVLNSAPEPRHPVLERVIIAARALASEGDNLA